MTKVMFFDLSLSIKLSLIGVGGMAKVKPVGA